MPDCPFCGEEVSDTAESCWKCGAEFGAEEPVLGEEEAGPLLVAYEIKACPHCDALVPKKAFRCNECGRKFDDFEPGSVEAAWKLGSGECCWPWSPLPRWASSTWRPRVGPKLPGSLFRIPSSCWTAWRGAGAETRRAVATSGDIWRRVEGKYVTWEGKVTARDESLIANEFLVKIDSKYRKKLPDVRVVFPLDSKEEVEHYDRGDKIRFTARLKELVNDDVVFLLDNAELAEAEKPKPPEKKGTPAPAPSEGG
jgi:DNA-directed RNA polymerase subunit RPC12/RpoP